MEPGAEYYLNTLINTFITEQMKTQKIYIERLFKLAKALEVTVNHPEHGIIGEVTLVDFAGCVRIPYQVKYQEFIFELLPEVFEEWGFNGKFGNPLPEGEDEEGSTIAAVIDFFNLNPDEFCFLFDVEGFQLIDQYGGGILTFESDGPEFARNIFELIKHKEADL